MSKTEEQLKFIERALVELERQHSTYAEASDMPLPEQLRHLAALFDAFDGGDYDVFFVMTPAEKIDVDDFVQQALRKAADLLEQKGIE